VECTCSEDVVRGRLDKRRDEADEASYVDKLHVYLKVKDVYESPLLDSVANSLPLIIYDTGLHKIEVHNLTHGNKGLELVLSSLKKLIKRFN
jgi:hypothetical protein